MDLTRIKEAAHMIAKKEPVLSNSVLFFLNILEAQAHIGEIISAYFRNEEGRMLQCLELAESEGSSLFDICYVPKIERSSWKEIASILSSALASQREDLREEADTINESLEEDLFDPESLARLSFEGDLNYARGVSFTIGVSEDLLVALGVWMMQSIFIKIREILEGKIDLKGWNRGFCPICGSYTRLSFSDENGVHLKCEICGMEWEYPEGTCPFCGSSDVGSAEPEEGFRMMRCNGCGNGWNFFDEGVIGRDIPRELYQILMLKYEGTQL